MRHADSYVDLRERAFGATPRVRVCDEDAELFADLPPAAQLEARLHTGVPAPTLERGPWTWQGLEAIDTDVCLGLLVLDGLLIHSVTVGAAPRSELVGPGDVIRPWDRDEDGASIPSTSDWRVVHRARVAVLDARFLVFAARWPPLMLAVVRRFVGRTHSLALQLAIADLRRIEDRLRLYFWHLADRWGRVAREGVVVPFALTHDVVAQLVCAQRPTVTTALSRLAATGEIRRRADKSWLLPTEPPPAPGRGPRPQPAGSSPRSTTLDAISTG